MATDKIKVRRNKLVEITSISLAPGTYEIVASVKWKHNKTGNRFFHVKHSDESAPTVSEAIDARTLMSISGGKQTMCGIALLGAVTVTLEVWSDVLTYIEDWHLGTTQLYHSS